jgi:hypothetical protein
MNKNRRTLPLRTRKKLDKEVKKGQAFLEIEPEYVTTNSTKASTELNKYPIKTRKADKPLIEKVKKQLEAKKALKNQPHSKRTTPGDLIGQDMAPAHVHTENERWNKTLTLQSKTQSKKLAVKLQKRGAKGKIK